MGKLFYLKAGMAFSLLNFGHMLSMAVAAGVYTNPTPNLQCTNDHERMFCQLGLKNCSEYKLILRSDQGYGEKNCNLRQCAEQCCCDVKMVLIFGESHTATVWKGNTTLESKALGVKESFKPRTPTITSVNETNNNFAVWWWTNMEEFETISLNTEMAYYKKGDPEMVWKIIQPSIPGGQKQQYFEINGQHLESSTTYVVRVRNVAEINGAVSDSSEEREFKTSASNQPLFSGIITALSIGVILIATAMNCCYVKLKANWWDKVPKPKIPIPVQHGEEMLLEPEECPLNDDVSIEPPKTDDCDCDFPNIGNPVLSPQVSVLASTVTGVSALFSPHTIRYDGSTSGSSAVGNASCSLLIPESSNTLGETADVQTQLGCNISFQSSKITNINIYGQDVSPLMPTGMCQPCSTDPQRFPHSENTSSSSISAFTSPSDKNPFSVFLLPGSHSSVVLEDDYKPIQSLVAQPDVLFSDKRSSDQGEDFDQEKPFSKIPRSCSNHFFPGVSYDAPTGQHNVGDTPHAEACRSAARRLSHPWRTSVFPYQTRTERRRVERLFRFSAVLRCSLS